MTHCTPEKLTSLLTQMEKEDRVTTTDYMVPEKDIEIGKRLRMIILKYNSTLIVQNKIYRDFAGFKYKELSEL